MRKFIESLNGLGRPVARAIGVMVLAGIGLAIVVAFVQWSFFLRELPKLPGEVLLIALLPYANSAWDNWVRSTEKKNTQNANVAIVAAGGSLPNPHGGPAAP